MKIEMKFEGVHIFLLSVFTSAKSTTYLSSRQKLKALIIWCDTEAVDDPKWLS